MAVIDLERIRKLDVVFEDEVADFVRNVRLATLQHEDNVAKIRALAKKLGALPATVSKYIWLQVFLAELVSSFEDVPSPSNVADYLEIPWHEFEKYFLSRAEYLHNLLEVDDFQPRQKKMPLQTMAPWETKEDFLSDLQEDNIEGD